jgi:hypothetical protein
MTALPDYSVQQQIRILLLVTLLCVYELDELSLDTQEYFQCQIALQFRNYCSSLITLYDLFLLP